MCICAGIVMGTGVTTVTDLQRPSKAGRIFGERKL